MAAGDYGFGVADLIPYLFLGVGGDTPRELTSSMNVPQKSMQLRNQLANLVFDPQFAMMIGAYAPPIEQDFVPVMPLTDSFLASTANPNIKKQIQNLAAGLIDPVEAANNIIQDPAAKTIARDAGSVMDGDEGKFWLDIATKIVAERGENQQRRLQWDQQQRDRDPFVKMGLPSIREKYGVEADPDNGVQLLPMDSRPMKYLSEASRLLSAGDPVKKASAGGKKPDLTSTKMLQSSRANDPNNAQRLAIARLLADYPAKKLAEAEAAGRTPLVDNLRYRAAIGLGLQGAG